MPPLHPTLAVPRHPLSVERLALVLTGYTIRGTGSPPLIPDVLDPASGSVPRGPYTISDANGKVLHVTEQVPCWAAERWAVRTWRGQAFDALPFGPADERAQLVLKAENRLLEAQIAANKARIAALNLPVDGDLYFLDAAMQRYGDALQALQVAQYRIDEYDEAQRAVAA